MSYQRADYEESKKDFTELGRIELIAREMVFDIRERGFDGDWGLIERHLASAFLASYHTERTRDDWMNLADALHGKLRMVDEDRKDRYKKSFNRLVRAGFLYSKAGKSGERVYGLHFDNPKYYKES